MGPSDCHCGFLLQAKYLAQIIVMGAQVVGRAFARAVRQEYAGMIPEVDATVSGLLYFRDDRGRLRLHKHQKTGEPQGVFVHF